MKTIQKKVTCFIFLSLSSCSLLAPHYDNELEEITEEVLKKKEGVDIQITPVDRLKNG